jgi:predicted TIM-barrel fold metal-dependent hydrolase
MALGALPAACGPDRVGDAPVAAEPIAVPVDHHVHLLGPDLIRDWKALGIPFSRPDSAYLIPDSVLARVDRAVLVPMGHAYGNSEMRAELAIGLDEEERRVARENDHVLAQAARFPDRAVALCTAPALRPYALREYERCIAAGGVGLKLHLAASEADLRDTSHLASLAQLTEWAAQRSLPILLHLDTQRRGTDVEHVDQFLRTVIEPHLDLTVIIAHLGGSGGYGRWTERVFETVNTWLQERFAADDARPGIWFDLSAAVLQEESEGVPATTDAEASALAADLAQFGTARLLFGSDAPSFDPRRYAAALLERGVLTRAALDSVLTRAPIFDSP